MLYLHQILPGFEASLLRPRHYECRTTAHDSRLQKPGDGCSSFCRPRRAQDNPWNSCGNRRHMPRKQQVRLVSAGLLKAKGINPLLGLRVQARLLTARRLVMNEDTDAKQWK